MNPTNRMKRRLRGVTSQHASVYQLVTELRTRFESTSTQDSVDLLYLMRSVAELFDDMRKELKSASELLERVICLRWVQATLNSEDDGPIRGKLATGIPKVKVMASLPTENKDPAAYMKLLKALGFSETAIALGLAKLHWPNVTDYFTSLAEKGLPLPPGIDPHKTYSLYSVTLRKRRP